MATVGEEFLLELAQRGAKYSFTRYEHYQRVKEIDSLEQLRAYLNANWYGPLEDEPDIVALATSFIAAGLAKSHHSLTLPPFGLPPFTKLNVSDDTDRRS